MSDVIKFNAKPKEMKGTASAKRCRKEGLVPVIVYGGPSKEHSLAISASEFEREYNEKRENFSTRLVNICLDGKTITTIAREVQFHPVSGAPLHVDFQEVSEGEIVRMKIRLRIINEEHCPGIKRGGVVNLVYRVIPMLCPINNIPDCIDIDISGMRIGDNKQISEINLPEGVRPVNKEDFTVISIGGSAEEDEDEAASSEEDTTSSEA